MLEVQAPVDIAALPSVTEEATEFLSRQVSTLLSSRPGAGTSRVPLTLAELCVQTLVSSFAETPRDFINSPLPDKFKLRIAQRLPVELDLALAARYVTAPGEASERYWQRRTQHAAFACAADTSRHGHSWRRTFFEQKIRDELERFTVSMELDELLAVLSVAQEHVVELRLSQLPSHVDLRLLLQRLPRLRRLELSYGARELGTEYEYSAFGMHDADCASLRAALLAAALPPTSPSAESATPATPAADRTATDRAATPSSARAAVTAVGGGGGGARLERLALRNTLLDDAKLAALAPGLAACATLTELDLSHNLIGDAGLRALADALCASGVGVSLETLNVGNNALTDQSGAELGRLLAAHGRLRELAAPLNELRSSGIQALAQPLASHRRLQRLILSSCSIGNAAVETLVPLLRQHSSEAALTHVDLSGNEIDDAHGRQLAALVSGSGKMPSLQQIDLRRNAACSDETIRDALGRR
eukprot:TRINITY_DN757_c0_g1_i2.p1 TRINITY_DN757_c0_g1~~TRINITY_DN757_c0_g1_i2.p1  ORF type:complete len:477 (+),score=201.30 TRINITY_DN757_c0_g1_i2:70-1500(+)